MQDVLFVQNIISDSIISSIHNTGAYEISKIIFEGNTYFSSDELLGYISSQATNISIPNKILSTYHMESSKNKYFPEVFVEQLYNSLSQFNNEYKYFNKDVVENDVKVLTDLYNINGFHFTNITYSYKPSNNNKGNTLIFHINENYHYVLASNITYKGLENLSPDVKKRFDTLVKLKKGDIFNEEKIESEIRAVHSLLLRSGYMHSKWNYPDVIMDTINNTDSIAVVFYLGDRIKIGNIIFVDSTRNQQIVANSSKRKFIRFNEGEYYNQNRIERSINNLLSTGVFESVSIDTVAKSYEEGDFIRDFMITSKYRKLRDWNAVPTINQTQVDGFINAGVTGEIFHRNMFGAAQATKLYGSITFKDVWHTILNIAITDMEFKIGMSYAQPVLWQMENIRISLSASFEYSWELLNGLFNISKISFPIVFQTRLPWNQYFSNFNVEVNISRENPVNYSSVEKNALNNAVTLQDTNNILSSLELYKKINNYLNEPTKHWFTSNLISLSITGDDRDNPFVTTSGSMTNIGIDGFDPIFLFSPNLLSGGARYLRMQATHTHFWKLSKNSVLGIKGKLGHTFVFDEENSFVPQDRQFFAGGANSVRAWAPRDLRYLNSTNQLPEGTITNFSKNYIGSKTLIDGSIEWRRKLNDIPGLSENFKYFIDGLALGFFIDFGNTFDWYAEEENNKTKINVSDYITKLAVGTGFGIRYETPIGPIRFDFATPLYDPMGRRPAFWDLVFVFGIGHAF